MADKEKKKKESIFDLSKYIDKPIRVKFQGGREASGVLKGFDPLLNLVLDGTIEYMRGKSQTRQEIKTSVKLGQFGLMSELNGTKNHCHGKCHYVQHDTVDLFFSNGQNILQKETVWTDVSDWEKKQYSYIVLDCITWCFAKVCGCVSWLLFDSSSTPWSSADPEVVLPLLSKGCLKVLISTLRTEVRASRRDHLGATGEDTQELPSWKPFS